MFKTEAFKLNEISLKAQDNTVLIYCYGIRHNDSFIEKIIQRLILTRVRSVILCNKGQSNSNLLLNLYMVICTLFLYCIGYTF